MTDKKTIYDIYHERMEYAAERTCSGDIAEAGFALGLAFMLASMHRDPDDETDPWTDRGVWAQQCQEVLLEAQSEFLDDETGTLRIGVGPPLVEHLTARAAEWSVSPQAVLMKSVEMFLSIADATDQGADVVLRGPGMQAIFVRDGVQLPGEQGELFEGGATDE